MNKSIVYYTHNQCDPAILEGCRKQIDRARGDIPVVAVSQHPLDWGDTRIVMPNLGSSDLSMFRQQLAGLEASDAEWVFFCEHDVLYHPSHFEFTPPRHNVYWFNGNVWAVDAIDGQAMHHNWMRMTSGVVACRVILIEHYTKKIEWVVERGKFSRQILGYEPGKRKSRQRLGNYRQRQYFSRFPNVDIKHGDNITRARFDPQEHRNWNKIKDSWQLADEVPGWGKCKGRFADFLEEATHDN